MKTPSHLAKDAAESVAESAADEVREVAAGRSGRTPFLMIVIVALAIAVVAGVVIAVAFLISSNS